MPLVGVACGLGLFAATACAHQPPAARPAIKGAALAVDRSGRVGELRLDGAWSLAADSRWFGGVSGARIVDARLLLLSDRSRFFELAWSSPPEGGDFAAPLLAVRAIVDGSGRDLDAEALAVGADGRRLVADEERSRVVGLAAGRPVGEGEVVRLPELASSGEGNAGVEAMDLLPGGDLVAIAEADEAGAHAGVVVGRDGRRPWRYRAAPGFSPTDLAVAPPWVFVLERRFSLFGGWRARIAAIPLTALAGGSDPVEGRELATIAGPRIGENYEALAVTREPGGYRLLAISDDNFHALQRTLLLSLFWPDERSSVAAAAGAP